MTAKWPSSTSAVAGNVAAVRGYGTSQIVTATHIAIPSDRYLTKLMAHLGARVEKNYGVGGSRLLTQTNVSGWVLTWAHTVDELPQPAPTLAGLPRPPREGLQVLHHGINDMGHFGNQSGWDTAFYYALLASVAQLRAGYVWQPGTNGPGHGRFNTTGWTNSSSADFGGDYVKHGTGSNITITYTTESGHPGGEMVFYIAQALGLSESCVVSAKIGSGSNIFTLDTTGIGVTDSGNPATIIPLFVPDVPAGAGNVVTLTFSSITNNINFLGATLTSEWPPVVVLVNQPLTITVPPPTWPNATAQVIGDGNDAIDAVADYFDTGVVAVADLSEMEGTSSYWVDDLHYSPDGNAKITDIVKRTISRAGGIPAGYSAGPALTTDGEPTWSGSPANGLVIDPATGILYTSIDIDTQAGIQPVNDLLLDISATSPANDDIFQLKAGSVTNRTLDQYIADLVGAGLFEAIDPGTVVFSGLGETLVAEPTGVAMTALIGALGAPTFDTHANRIAASHQEGVYWIEADTGLHFYDDGVDWQILSPFGRVVKTSPQTITGNGSGAGSTLRDITGLKFPVEPGEIWEVRTNLWVSADVTTTDFKTFWTFSAGSGNTFTSIRTGDLTSPATGTNPVLAVTDAVNSGGSANGTFQWVSTVLITVGDTACNVQFRAAQFLDDGSTGAHNTTILAPATLYLELKS